jgi:hypothetical protein
MKLKCAELRWQSHEPLRSIAWHHEGKHFVSSHIDGSLCTWPLRATAKPQLQIYPHAKQTKDGKLETCKPIHKVDLRTNRNRFVFAFLFFLIIMIMTLLACNINTNRNRLSFTTLFFSSLLVLLFAFFIY